VDLSHGRNYGDTVSWFEQDKPASLRQPVRILVDLDSVKFCYLFTGLNERPDAEAVSPIPRAAFS